MNSTRSFFEQSRRLIHVTTNDWRDAVFASLTSDPINYIYSIAFSLAFCPSLKSQDDFTASSELFDLLDDLIYDTDTLPPDELLARRLVTKREHDESMHSFLNHMDGMTESIRKKYVTVIYEENIKQNTIQPENTRMKLTDVEMKEVSNVLTNVSKETTLPLPVAMNVSRVVTTFNDMQPQEWTTINKNSSYISTWDIIEIYLRYAPIYYKYKSLRSIIERCEKTRGIKIYPIYMPAGCIWQGGTSQLLWIVLHTIASLCVERQNLYVRRLIVVLKYLKYFILCAHCKIHWNENLGIEYFTWLENQTNVIIERRLPIDLLLLRVHNAIARNSTSSRALSDNTLAEVALDYRHFARYALLQRTKDPTKSLGDESYVPRYLDNNENNFNNLLFAATTRFPLGWW